MVRLPKAISNDAARGVVKLGHGRLLFPNMILFVETSDHYIAETFGATLRFQGLVERIHKDTSTSKYIYQFTDAAENPIVTMNARNSYLKNLLLSRQVDVDRVKARFGFDPQSLHPTKLVMTKTGGSLLAFGPQFESCYLDNCALINTFDQVYRMKDILHLTVVSKALSPNNFVEDQQSRMKWPVDNPKELSGIHFVPDKTVEQYKLSGQFANLFLIPGLKEPNIGKYLHRNPAILVKALGADQMLYEKRFIWLEGNSDPLRNSIIPDFLLRRSGSHYWDICDIKRPLLDKNSLTKGSFARRRFVDEVGEGIAQLANYEEYFKFEKNSAFARHRYGVELDSPQLTLIVGNYENANQDEIQQASRSLKPNYAIIDYDSLNIAYLGKAATGPDSLAGRLPVED